MDNKYILSSLSQDLKRIALGLHRGSLDVAEKFSEEARKRIDEVSSQTLSPYIQKILEKTKSILNKKDKTDSAEDFLLYSVLFQNYALKLT